MTDIRSKIRELYSIEQLTAKDTVIHRIHPSVKLTTALIFIISVVSFDRYSIGRMIPYIFYPAVVMALAEIPPVMVIKRSLIAVPFCLFAGISNVIFDRGAAFYFASVAVTYGVVSLITIIYKTLLCVSAILILMAVTGVTDVAAQLRRFHIPEIMVTILEMVYRYIGVLAEEASTMCTSYRLRSSGVKGIKMKDMGTFVGQLLLRSFDRAERVYAAMVCRGYRDVRRSAPIRKLSRGDIAYLVIVSGLCVLFRTVDVTQLLTDFLGGF